VADAAGSTVSQDVTLTISGSNDAPALDASNSIVSGDYTEQSNDTTSGRGTYPAATLSGTLFFIDVDSTDSLSFDLKPDTLAWSGGSIGSSFAETMASALTIDIFSNKNVAWTFEASDSVFDFLANKETLTINYSLKVTDKQEASIEQIIDITITGSNDPFVFNTKDSELSLIYTEPTDISGSGLIAEAIGTLYWSDNDTSDSIKGNSSSLLSVNWSRGELSEDQRTDVIHELQWGVPEKDVVTNTIAQQWSYPLEGNQIDFLSAGDELSIVLLATTMDAQLNETTNNIVITIVGSNDIPLLDDSFANTVNIKLTESNDYLSFTGAVKFMDPDYGDAVIVTLDDVFSSGLLPDKGLENSQLMGWMSLNYDYYSGAQNWYFNNVEEKFDYLRSGVGYQNIEVIIEGTNDKPIIDKTFVAENREFVEAGDSIAKGRGWPFRTLITER
jgi:VCBS repeat-containing protein